MKGKHKKTLQAMQRKPTPSNIAWSDVESLLVACGAVMTEGKGSRVKFDLNGVTLSAHRPHPEKEAKRYQIKDVLIFLRNSGVL